MSTDETQFTPHIPGGEAVASPEPVQSDPMDSDTPELETVAPSAGGGSIRDRMRQRQHELAADRDPLDLDIPGYEGEMFIRFKYVPPGIVGKNAEKLAKIKSVADQTLIASIDTLVACCEGVYVREEDGKEEPLAEDGSNTRFDEALVVELGGNPRVVNTARKACMFAFGDNGYAVMEMASDVSKWLKGDGPDGDDKDFYEELAGNSNGRTTSNS